MLGKILNWRARTTWGEAGWSCRNWASIIKWFGVIAWTENKLRTITQIQTFHKWYEHLVYANDSISKSVAQTRSNRITIWEKIRSIAHTVLQNKLHVDQRFKYKKFNHASIRKNMSKFLYTLRGDKTFLRLEAQKS